MSADRGVGPDSTRGSEYYAIHLLPLRAGPGSASGYATVWFPDSPFTVALTRDGYYVREFSLRIRGLPDKPNTVYVVWVASADLESLDQLGVVTDDRPLTGRLDFDNQYILFVTAEASADIPRPRGRTVLRGISRSGLLESMFGHGFCPRNELC